MLYEGWGACQSVSRTRPVVGFGISGPDLHACNPKGSTLSMIWVTYENYWHCR